VSNVSTVQAIYTAFGAGDVPTILGKLDDSVVLINFEAKVGDKTCSFPNNGHLWQFNAAGKVVKYDHVTDTAQMIRLAEGE